MLIEIVLPDTDGIELTRLLRTEMPGVRIVGVSAKCETLGGKLRKAGAIECVSKFDLPDNLIELVRNGAK